MPGAALGIGVAKAMHPGDQYCFISAAGTYARVTGRGSMSGRMQIRNKNWQSRTVRGNQSNALHSRFISLHSNVIGERKMVRAHVRNESSNLNGSAFCFPTRDSASVKARTRRG